ncbi:MAG: ABC transporter substrate-binding protein, partial [Dehalococcoidia bacterium]
MPEEGNYWQHLAGRGIARRQVLRAAALGGAGLTTAGAFACGGSSKTNKSNAASSGARSGASAGTAAADAGAAAGASSGSSEANGKPGGTLVLSHSGNPPNYDIVSTSYVTSGFSSLVYNGLLTFHNGNVQDPNPVDNTVVPDLAAAMPEQPDNQTYVFKLRPDVKWQNKPPLNGRALTADDSKWHFERAAGITEPTSTLKTDFGVIDKIETPDAQTVKLTLKSPYAPFLNLVIGGFNRYVEPKEVGV